EYLLLLSFNELQLRGRVTACQTGGKPRGSRACLDLPNEFVTAVLLKDTDLNPGHHSAHRIGSRQKTSRSPQNRAEPLAIFKPVAARKSHLTVDRYRLTHVIPIGDLVNRQNVSRLEGDVSVRVGSGYSSTDSHRRKIFDEPIAVIYVVTRQIGAVQ